MPSPQSDLENRLIAGLRQKSEFDQQSLTALEAIQSRIERGESLPDACVELQEILSAVTTADAEMGPLRDEWHAAGRAPTLALRGELDRQQAVLETLLSRIGEVEAVANTQRVRLAPQLDIVARGRQMRAAYGAAGAGTGRAF